LRITASIPEALFGLGLRQGTDDWLEQHTSRVISANSAQHSFNGEAFGGA
jgi:hypothetical protein